MKQLLERLKELDPETWYLADQWGAAHVLKMTILQGTIQDAIEARDGWRSILTIRRGFPLGIVTMRRSGGATMISLQKDVNVRQQQRPCLRLMWQHWRQLTNVLY